MDRTEGVRRMIVCIAQWLLLAGCGDGADGGDGSGAGGAGDAGGPRGNAGAGDVSWLGGTQAAGQSPPHIDGSPPKSVLAGSTYEFTPQTADADGDTLTFSIANRPSWAKLNPSTGRLSGKPDESHVGTYTDIVISVSDGATVRSLEPFSIAVVVTASGAATLSWHPPTERVDGSPLANGLAGYRIYWRRGVGRGAGASAYTDSVTIDNPGIASYTVENLTPGAYSFAITAFDVDGVESEPSAPVSKTIDEYE